MGNTIQVLQSELVSLKLRAMVADFAMAFDRLNYNWRMDDTRDSGGNVYTVMFVVKLGTNIELRFEVKGFAEEQTVIVGAMTARWLNPMEYAWDDLRKFSELQDAVQRVLDFNGTDTNGIVNVG